MKRATMLIAIVGAAALTMGSAAAAKSSGICVGSQPGCFASIQQAIDAAHDGDTIDVGVGTFQGGITIDKSVQLIGTSAAATTIAGGGPVVTIGSLQGDNEDLNVGLSRLTITGGLNDSQPSMSVVAGGGVWIPGSAGMAVGATVSIDDSVITGNLVTASATIPPGGFSCPLINGHPCAFVNGGGIDNSGILTVTDTRVTDNVAGAAPGGSSLASDASGGGIDNHPQGTLMLRHCRVIGNRAAVNPPDGAFTEAGGVLDGGTMVIENSSVDDNASVAVSSVSSFFPFDVDQSADAGGVDVSVAASATISGSSISGNTLYGFDSRGDAQAINGGIDDDGSLVLTDSTVSRNSVTAEVPAASGLPRRRDQRRTARRRCRDRPPKSHRRQQPDRDQRIRNRERRRCGDRQPERKVTLDKRRRRKSWRGYRRRRPCPWRRNPQRRLRRRPAGTYADRQRRTRTASRRPDRPGPAGRRHIRRGHLRRRPVPGDPESHGHRGQQTRSVHRRLLNHRSTAEAATRAAPTVGCPQRSALRTRT